MTSRLNFVRQQGFTEAPAESCERQYPALMVQPRILFGLILLGIAAQWWPWFAGLGLLLVWCALLPRLNPFDMLHNRVVAGPVRLAPAPGPRRFAQGLAGALMLAIAGALYTGASALAWTIELVLAAAVAALVFGRFCLGSFLFLVLTGRGGYAMRTLPWARRGPS